MIHYGWSCKLEWRLHWAARSGAPPESAKTQSSWRGNGTQIYVDALDMAVEVEGQSPTRAAVMHRCSGGATMTLRMLRLTDVDRLSHRLFHFATDGSTAMSWHRYDDLLIM